MTSKQEKLIENYIRLKVKSMLKEDINQEGSLSKWLNLSIDDNAWFDVQDLKQLNTISQKKMKEISDKMEMLSKQLVALAIKSGLKINQ